MCLAELPFGLRINLLENHKGICYKEITKFLHLQKLYIFSHDVVHIPRERQTYLFIFSDSNSFKNRLNLGQ